MIGVRFPVPAYYSETLESVDFHRGIATFVGARATGFAQVALKLSSIGQVIEAALDYLFVLALGASSSGGG